MIWYANSDCLVIVIYRCSISAMKQFADCIWPAKTTTASQESFLLMKTTGKSPSMPSWEVWVFLPMACYHSTPQLHPAKNPARDVNHKATSRVNPHEQTPEVATQAWMVSMPQLSTASAPWLLAILPILPIHQPHTTASIISPCLLTRKHISSTQVS